MTYPFKLIGSNVNRRLFAVGSPALDAQQIGSKNVPGVAYSYRGVWSSTMTINQGDIVLYGTTMWLALSPSINVAPDTGSTQWQGMGSYNAYRGAWSSTVAYVPGDEVTYSGNFWLATQNSTNQAPATGSAYWQVSGPQSLDDVSDGNSMRRTSATYVDSSNRPYQLHRASGGIDVSADLLTQQTEVTSHIGGQNVSTIDLLAKVTGRTADRITYVSGGATVDSLKPEEVGANVTETRVSLQTSNLNNHSQTDLVGDATYARTTQQQGATAGSLPIPNAMFQLGSGTTLPGWQLDGGTATPSFQTSAPSPNFGAQYFQLKSNTNDSTYYDTVQTFKCKPNDIVTFGGTVQSISAANVAGVAIMFRNAAGTTTGSSYEYTTAAGVWQSVAGYLAAPAGTVYCQLRIILNATASGQYGFFNEVWASINDATQPNSAKAFINANDTTAGGHTGQWQHNFMSTGVQNAITSTGSIVNVCAALNNTEQGTAFDGSAVTFSNSYPSGTVPIVVYLPGGLTYDNTLPAGAQQEQVFLVNSLTNTGFTPYLKIQSLPTSPANQSVNFTPYNSATSSATATLSVPGGSTITNGAMMVNFSVTLPQDSSDTVTITVAGTQEWSKLLVTGGSGKTWYFNVPVTNSSAVNGSTVVVADSATGIKATTVTYQTGVAGTTHTATPTGSAGVPFIVLPPPT